MIFELEGGSPKPRNPGILVSGFLCPCSVTHTFPTVYISQGDGIVFTCLTTGKKYTLKGVEIES